MAEQTKVIQLAFREDGSSRVVSGIKKMSGATKQARSQVDLLKSAMLKLGGFIAFTAAMKAATTAALSFGAAMAEVKTLLDDTSQFDNLTESVKEISLQFGQAPTDQAKALYQIVSAGATEAAVAVDLLTVSNKLAVAGVTDVAVAADALTTVLNAFGDEAGSAIDVSDAFFVAVKAGKTTVDELARGIGEVSGVAANVGVSFEEVLSATAALTKGTLNTAKSMRGLRGVMQAIFAPTQEATELAEQLGLQFNAAGLKSLGLSRFLQEVSKATKNNVALLGQLFGNVEGLIPVLALGGSAAGDFAANLLAMEERAGKTDAALAIMAETAKFKLNRFLTALTLVAIRVGDALLTVLAPAAEFAADNMDLLVNATIALTAALIAINFSAVISGLKGIALGIKSITLAMASNPIGLLAVGMAALVVGVIELNKNFMILEPTWEILKTGFLFFLNELRIGFNRLLIFFDQVFAKINQKLSELKIKYQEAIVFISSKIGTDLGFQNAIDRLEELKTEQEDYNSIIRETSIEREEAIKQLRLENEKLQERAKIAKEQLFVEREILDVREQAVGTAGGGLPGTDETNAALAEQENRQVRLLELQKRGKELMQQLRSPTEIFRDNMKELNQLYEAGAIDVENYNRAMKKYQDEMKGSSEATDEFGQLMEKAIDGTLTAKDLFLVAVKQILRGLFEMNQEAQNTTNSFLDMANSIGGGGGGGGLGGILGSIIGGFFSPTASIAGAIPAPPVPVNPAFTGLLAADGAVFNNGFVQKFQKGGVVGGPTAFPMRGGTGLMGEAGEEAIMPLTRGSGGRLGVDASGISQVVNVSVVDQRSGGEPAEVKETVDSQGNRRFSIFIRDEVNRGFATGSFDKSLKIFGIQRGGKRR